MGTIKIDQISSMNIAYKCFTFEYFLESTAKLGFKSFEFWAGSPHLCFGDSNISKISTIRRKVEESGLKITCLTGEQALYMYNMAAREPKLRNASIEYFRRLIAAAGELGVDKYLLSIGWSYLDEPAEESWKRGIDAGAEVLKEAERSNVKIVWEVMPQNATSQVNNVETSKRVVTDLDSEYSRICIDTCAIAVVNETLEDFFRAIPDKVYHIHLNDGSPSTWSTWGDGTQDLDEHLRTLAKYNYQDTISLEVGFQYQCDPEDALRRGRKYVNQHLPFTV